jgi:thiol-disulfide isomerase/thioredoxin
MRSILFVLFAALLMVGCAQEEKVKIETNDQASSQTAEAKVFFYFSPTCPSCVKIKPYMDLMRGEVEEVNFDFCNVSNFKACTNESQWVAKHIGLMGVPTVVLMYGNNVTVLVGWRNVAKLGNYLQEIGIDTPDVVYGSKNYDVQDCIKCHEERGIAPPSTYNCTYCCHYSQGS